jgi:hypothetical protein
MLKLAVKWLPCGWQKMLATLFWHLKREPYPKNPKNNITSKFMLGLWLHGFGLSPAPKGGGPTIRLVGAGVPMSDVAVNWLPGSCQKLHPTVFWQLETKARVKNLKKKYLFLVAACTLTLWVGTMLSAPGRNEKYTFGLARCAVVGYCCKMAPLQLPKVASNRFLAFGDKIKSVKTEKIVYSSLLPVLWLCALGLGCGHHGGTKKILLIWAGVPLSDFAV